MIPGCPNASFYLIAFIFSTFGIEKERKKGRYFIANVNSICGNRQAPPTKKIISYSILIVRLR
jgi:hypothetical protein